jgi:hypothetical protein
VLQAKPRETLSGNFLSSLNFVGEDAIWRLALSQGRDLGFQGFHGPVQQHALTVHSSRAALISLGSALTAGAAELFTPPLLAALTQVCCVGSDRPKFLATVATRSPPVTTRTAFSLNATVSLPSGRLHTHRFYPARGGAARGQSHLSLAVSIADSSFDQL